MESGGNFHFLTLGFWRGPTGGSYTQVELLNPPGKEAEGQRREGVRKKAKPRGCELLQSPARLLRASYEWALNTCPPQLLTAFLMPSRPRLFSSLHLYFPLNASDVPVSPVWQGWLSPCNTHRRRGRSWQSQWKGTSLRLRISSPVKLLMAGMLLMVLFSRWRLLILAPRPANAPGETCNKARASQEGPCGGEQNTDGNWGQLGASSSQA